MAYSFIATNSSLESYALFVIENERKMFSVDTSRRTSVRFKSNFLEMVQNREITLSSIEA